MSLTSMFLEIPKSIYTGTTRLEDTDYVSSFDGNIRIIRNNKYEQELQE